MGQPLQPAQRFDVAQLEQQVADRIVQGCRDAAMGMLDQRHLASGAVVLQLDVDPHTAGRPRMRLELEPATVVDGEHLGVTLMAKRPPSDGVVQPASRFGPAGVDGTDGGGPDHPPCVSVPVGERLPHRRARDGQQALVGGHGSRVSRDRRRRTCNPRLDSVAAVIRWRDGRVVRVVRIDAESADLVVRTSDDEVPALAYLPLVGQPEPGDRVLLNVTALELGLGTGGHALVIALPDRLPPDRADPGHVVKARYTPLQATVLAVDEQDSPHHDLLRDADDLAGMPVVVADLHSALPAVVAGARSDGTTPRIVYVMSDGGALPLWLSRTVPALRAAGWVAATVTVGQAFGGDVEAVTVHSGLLAARHVLGADLAVVTQGPGNLGTGTRWGFSGVATGEAVNAVNVLGGRPVAALRVSAADERERHRGVSHHSLTALGRVALSPAEVVVPLLDGEFGAQVRQACEPLAARHRLVDVAVDGLLDDLRGAPVRLSSMGRGLDDDPAYFLAAAAAGRHATRLL